MGMITTAAPRQPGEDTPSSPRRVAVPLTGEPTEEASIDEAPDELEPEGYGFGVCGR